jgi:glucose/arabinose dehydrogenase
MRSVSTLFLLLSVLLVAWSVWPGSDSSIVSAVAAPQEKSGKPFGIDKRVPLRTSTVVGSPDPLPPYRVERAYPKLKMNFPILVRHIPGSDQLLTINEESSYGDTVINQMNDDPNTAASSKILALKGVAYDIAFDPRFKENGFIYIGWNGAGEKEKAKHSKVTRYTMSPRPPYKLDKDSAKLIIEWASDGHNGAAVCFGNDGMMYITSGDGTSDSDTNVTGQRMDLLLAKVLRIDVDHPDKGKAYSVPKDNPFVNLKDARPETWAIGLRNPWRIHCDKKTGHIWVGNNGQDLWEQIYFVRKGDNFGWSVYEGSHPFYLNRKLGPAAHTKPTLEHHHSEARSMTGGLVYYGEKYPDLIGAYVYGDYSTGRIWAAKHDGNKVVWHKELAQTRLQITGFGTDSKGEILICDHNGNNEGGLFALVPTPKETKPKTFPKKLSESGLFTSVNGHKMQPAMIPYSVNSPLWSDGAYKERWLGLPGADSTIDYKRNRGWGFPDQTVIVKSFALEFEEGKPESRRWIETRFLTKQGKEWFGYSYRWNDEQTDAVLVESMGADKDYSIRTRTGLKAQRWHYPSRSECMVCHSRAAEWVLGLSEAQMNKDLDYGGCIDNQLRVFDHLGLFKQFNKGDQTKEILREQLEAQGWDERKIKEYLAKKTDPKLKNDPAKAMTDFSPNNYRKLADPYDRKADIQLRARSYLHSNCAQCHVEAGGGNAQMELEFHLKPDRMKVVDVKPVHNSFGLADARLVAPGHPERSVLLRRLSHREQGYMPPLATNVVDKEAVEMLSEWIRKMPERK